MKYAIIYSSRTGNTRLLAETVKNTLTDSECIYFGSPDTAALSADRIYVGFWTDKGTCDKDTANFLGKLTDQEIYLFGTAGFGEKSEYFDKVIKQTEKNLNSNVKVIGSFMCQGKMPMSVRQRYEKMLESSSNIPNITAMIENFDKALEHPNENDLIALKKALR